MRQELKAIIILLAAASYARGEPYPARWFLLTTNFLVQQKADRALELVEQAAGAGLNGVILADSKFMTLEKTGLDTRDNYRGNVGRFLAACRRHGIEVIPYLRTVSRAESILSYDVNLAAGYEVRDAVFEVRGGVGRLVPDPAVKVINAGFEETQEDRFPGWRFHDRPGLATVVERVVKRSGRQSARLEPAAADQHGHCRFYQGIRVTPHRRYRVSVWLQTHNLAPENCFNIYVKTKTPTGWRSLTFDHSEIHGTKATQSWKQAAIVFNSMEFDQVTIMMGLWKARSGQAWLDDVDISEIGLVNVLRRPGCPLTVKSVDGKVTYLEGLDFMRIADPRLGHARWAGTYDRYHEPPSIRMYRDLPDGARLLASFYHPMLVDEHQVDCCLTEAKVYEIFDRQIRRLVRFLGTRRHYFLGLDELRTGGSCALCKATGKTPGQLLGNSISRLAAIIRGIQPGAELIVWHDMFDPNCNARDDYYLMDGTLAGSWEGLDDKIIICPWYFEKREKSMAFFAGRGHRQIVSADFDPVKDSAAYLSQWLVTMERTPGVMGMMYTTWHHDYGNLAAFGRIIGSHQRVMKPKTADVQ